MHSAQLSSLSTSELYIIIIILQFKNKVSNIYEEDGAATQAIYILDWIQANNAVPYILTWE